ncbi:hypothetical protein AB0L25_09845 [Spirillospora sp. NPDC052242]
MDWVGAAMTYDLIVLLPTAPDVADVVGGLVGAGPGLRVRPEGGGAVLRLYDDDRPVLGIEEARRVDVADDVRRLLGAQADEGLRVPYWWTEIRASAGGGDAEAAHRLADELVRRLGGRVWSPREAR